LYVYELTSTRPPKIIRQAKMWSCRKPWCRPMHEEHCQLQMTQTKNCVT